MRAKDARVSAPTRWPRTPDDCYDEAERRACQRIEKSMERLLKSAYKRRNTLEVRLGLQSPEYLIAVNEYVILQHWRDWMRRNCDYRMMQVDERRFAHGKAQGGR